MHATLRQPEAQRSTVAMLVEIKTNTAVVTCLRTRKLGAVADTRQPVLHRAVRGNLTADSGTPREGQEALA